MKIIKSTYLFIGFFSIIWLFTRCVPPSQQPVPDNVPDIRILLGRVVSTDTVIFEGTYLLEAEEAVYEFGSSNRNIYIQPIEHGYRIFNENRMLRFRNQDKCRLVPEKPESLFRFRGGRYKGSINLIKSTDKLVSIINAIGLEDYLKAVVPAEIYTGNEELLESAKAQAICSRTYALHRMNERKGKAYDVHIDVRDQVYGSLRRQNSVASAAVSETQGIVLNYNDSLATVYFHSSCGGVLEEAGNVWQNINAPYLTSRQDVLGDSFACRFAPNHRWKETRTFEQIDSAFQECCGISRVNMPVEDTTEIKLNFHITDRYKSGRVSGMRIEYGDTLLHLAGYEIRRFLGWPPGQLLPSTLFRLRKKNDSAIVIEGGGAGHGVGLCQWGAMRMSVEGFRYYHILGKYFKGCYLKKIY